MVIENQGVTWWTAEEVAQFWGIRPRSVRDTMLRHKVAPHPHLWGPRGQRLYPSELVKQAKANAPGQGNRTNHPLKNPKKELGDERGTNP